jgi:PilZ domain
MKERSESPVEMNQPVMITALHNENATFTARFVDLSSEGMRIKLNADLEVGSLLRLEFGEDLMMTEVCHCEPDEGEYSAGLSILSWLEKSELKRLRYEAVAGPSPQCVPA